ncbi:helix-turn-helix domain-containing protein [uncultured Mailhella sp.]|uniref:helix-turn-helix domain-containing protein n=1 Tax=uncultured Mailhella sp. TaxID=1981031 RepID=UPI00344FD49E
MSRCRVVVRESPVPEYKAEDVARIRKSLDLSQRTLANALGVSTRTVEAWEAGRNVPSGAARHLLYLFDCDHSLVDKLIVR